MSHFIGKRLVQMAVVFVFVSMFAFSIIYFSPGDPLYLYTSPSVSVYKMTDEQLEQGDYSREEISQGLLAAAKQYGYDGMVGALLS